MTRALAIAAIALLGCGEDGTPPGGGSAGSGGVLQDSGGSSGHAGAAGHGGDDAGGSGGSPADSGHDAAPAECPHGLPGPAMVLLPVPGGARYCMDATEVSQGHYFEFLAAKGGRPDGSSVGDVSGQIPECAWNQKWTPESLSEYFACAVPPPTAFDPLGGHAGYPVGCVDWCDAHAYCQWAGKRLCGKVGGGHIAEGEEADPKKSQWHNACSQGGTTAYPYGNTYQSGACPQPAWQDGPDGGSTLEGVQPVSAPTTCHGTATGFDQVTNLAGNLAEWTDGRMPPPDSDLAPILCIRDVPDSEKYSCGCVSWTMQNTREPYYGFRCCADLP